MVKFPKLLPVIKFQTSQDIFPETVVITDVNVNHLYGGYWSNWPNIAIGVGENILTP